MTQTRKKWLISPNTKRKKAQKDKIRANYEKTLKEIVEKGEEQ